MTTVTLVLALAGLMSLTPKVWRSVGDCSMRMRRSLCTACVHVLLHERCWLHAGG